MEDTKPMVVSVADGFKVQSTQRCRKYKWSAQGQDFCHEIWILPLEGINVVLGV